MCLITIGGDWKLEYKTSWEPKEKAIRVFLSPIGAAEDPSWFRGLRVMEKG
jgi:hypothetical protein